MIPYRISADVAWRGPSALFWRVLLARRSFESRSQDLEGGPPWTEHSDTTKGFGTRTYCE